jgi:hypothetical protein
MAAKYSYYRNVRSDLADGIEAYWAGERESVIGLQYLDLQDGRLVKGPFLVERTDILWVHGPTANAFVEPDGRIQVDRFRDRGCTDRDAANIERAARRFYRRELEYVEHEARFLNEKPWLQIIGLTPANGVKRMRELGW